MRPHRELLCLNLSDAKDAYSIRRTLECAFPDLRVQARTRFLLISCYFDDAISLKKSTTVRYEKGAVEYPAATQLPVIEVQSTDEGTPELGKRASAKVVAVCYKSFGDLNDSDAHRDGFSSRCELKEALQRIYGLIHDDEVVSIFNIALDGKLSNVQHAAFITQAAAAE